MNRIALLFVPFVVFAFAPLSEAKRIAAPPNPVQRALTAEVVITGKVTAIEKDAVEVEEVKDSPKVAYKIAVIKVESSLAGAANTTHVKVGFPANARPGRGRIIALEENQEGLFFLSKHPSGQFHTFNWMSVPVEATAEDYKASVTNVKKALAVVADSSKALKSEKAEERSFAAIAMILKYRTAPQSGGEVGLEKIPVEESKLILKGLADADWSKPDPSLPPPANAFYLLGLTEENGWVQPKVQPGADFNEELRKAFVKWLDGAGKDYRISKYVRK